ncbi:MAG: pre-peptidase C-terminal domain-containing protein [Gammaproteobacteria bacterium]|jgi:hypothetical protein
MNHGPQYFKLLFIAFVVLVLAACSGGGDGDGDVGGSGSSPKPHVVTGTGATGLPIANATIRAKGVTGVRGNGTTDADGKFNVSFSDVPGVALIKVERNDGPDLFSIFSTEGEKQTGGQPIEKTVNIHPYTDLIVRNWFAVQGLDIETAFDNGDPIADLPTAEDIDNIKAAIEGLINIALIKYTLPNDFDFIGSAFNANQTGFDGFLDNSLVAINNNIINISVTDNTTNITNNIVVNVNLDRDLTQPDTLGPSDPQNVRAVASNSEIIVVWEPSTDDLGVAGYNIYRDGVLVDSTPYPVFADSGLDAATQYCYSVEAVDGAGNVSNTVDAAACTMLLPAPDSTPPAAPQALQIIDSTVSSNSLEWSPPSDLDLYRFDVYRNVNGGAFERIATVISSSYVDQNISDQLEYCYRVVALDASLNPSDPSNEVCTGAPTNDAPVANAGNDQNSVPVGSTVLLNGNLSTDPNGDQLTYQWQIISQPTGSAATLSDATIINPTFVADAEGTYEIQLIVNDGLLDSDPDTVLINTSNTAPVADAGNSRTVTVGQVVNLDGSASSDINGDQLTYSWEITNMPGGSTALLSDSTAVDPTFTADTVGDYVVTLVVNDGLADSAPAVITITAIAPGAEAEPNDTINLAQPIPLIGADNPVAASIDPVGDQDWFQFTATQGVTYSIELYDVNNTLDDVLGTGTDACDPFTNLRGLAIEVFNSTAATSPVAAQCEPMGSGNVHNMLTFSPNTSGTYYIRISHNAISSTRVGGYNLRILPDYANGATWDANEEPNNTAYNAYGLTVDTAVTSNIGQRDPAFATNTADIDWYRFEATQNVTYTVELFDANTSLDTTLGTGNSACDPLTNHRGMAIEVFNAAGAITPVKAQCAPTGSGNVQNLMTFTATANTTYFIRISLNAITTTNGAGNYSIRVLPDYTNGATWDVNEEPNNTAYNAYGLTVDTAVTSNIDQRDPAFATNTSDIDWYRFEATQDVTYTVELFDASTNLDISLGTGNNACDPLTNFRGMAIEIFDAAGAIAPIKAQCKPTGSGNTHNLVTFTATSSATYFIRVSLNAIIATNDTGNYSIRVLPDYANSATWDANEEPNNTAYNAFSLMVDTAVTSNIAQRDPAFSTNTADIDWYRFDATQDVTYTVELFDTSTNLDISLGTGGRACDPLTNFRGMAIEVFDAAGAIAPIAAQCDPNGSGNVHNLVTFTASSNTTYYIRVSLNAIIASNDAGNYSIRVLPDYLNSATWDANEESNNTAHNAFNLTVSNPVTSNIVQRNVSFSTNTADIDWYRFEGAASTSYTIELFDVATGLRTTLGTDPAACDPNTVLRGVAIEVFDGTGTARINASCNPTGDNAPMHNSLTFTTGAAGTYFIRISLNALTSNDNGAYSIQIVP